MTMTATTDFRTGTAEDLDAVKKLLAAASLPFEDLYVSAMPDFLVQYEDGELIAVGGIEPYGKGGLLRSVAVSEKARGRGLGTAITRALEVHAESRGIETLYLLTTTAADFFPRHGYVAFDRDAVPEAVAKSREFSSICPASAVCLRKILN